MYLKMTWNSLGEMCVLRIMRFTCLSFIFAVVFRGTCHGFNVDVKFPLIYSSKSQTNFGYSVGLFKSATNSMLLVGAPKDNSSMDSTKRPGVIYACGLQNTACSELNLQLKKEVINNDRRKYDELRDDGWLGVSIDIAPDDSHFVACGHLWKDAQYVGVDKMYVTNGICYLGSTDLNMNNVRRLLPLVMKNNQVYKSQYIYALGLSGFSSHFSRDGSTLMLGAPGAYRFSGTVTAVERYKSLLTDRSLPDYRVFPSSIQSSDDSYFGYSITSGKFFKDKLTYYASGAPREGPNGKVYIYSLPVGFNDEVAINGTLDGHQMGEYFGNSLCAADFNGDGFDDLVVGAPFFSTEIDEGRVYVYLSNGISVDGTRYHLTGSSALEGRFGITVTAIGDLNLDGYNDLAVGAPYEGNGAVYIFHGSSKGLKEKFAQRIAASDFNVQIKGFGTSISRSKDIDDNFYPDLAIGAPVLSNAVILRSKPVVKITGKITFSLNHINTDVKNCSLITGEPITCFQVDLCSSYTGKYAPDTIDIQTVVVVDQQLSRVLINSSSTDLVANLNFTATFKPAVSNCRSLTLFVKKDVQDFLTPVRISATHVLVPSDRERFEFCRTCPAIDGESSGAISKSITFYTGCGDDDKCISDLVLDVSFPKYRPGDAFVLGTEDTLQLSLSVTNNKEPAFQTILMLSIPSDVDFVRLPSECSASFSSNVTCTLGNPLTSGRTVSLDIVLDMKRLSVPETLVFDINVTTTSDLLGSTSKDVSKSLTLPIKSVTGISLTGWVVYEEQFVYNRSDPGLAPVTHMYQISMAEPSPISEMELEFKFPIATTKNESFIRNLVLDVKHNYKSIPCKTSVQTPASPLIVLEHEETEHGLAAIMDCNSLACHVFKCKVGRFVKRDTILVNLTATVELSTVVQKIMSEEKLVILRSSGSVALEERRFNFMVKTVFVPQDLVPQSAGAAWWIYLVAILGGILLLALLIFAMYKFGFFQRKRPDKENLMSENDSHLEKSDNEEEMS